MSHIKKALEAFHQYDYITALSEFEKALEETPNDPGILNNIGLCQTQLEQYEEAEQAFVRALAIDKAQIQVYLNMSDLYYRQFDMLKAIEILHKGIFENPDNPTLRHYLARVYLADVRYDLAIEQLEYVLEMSPKNYDAYWDLGRIYFDLGVWDMAIENYEKVLEYNDLNPLIHYNIALAYEANDDIDKAISYHLKAICADHKFPYSHKKLGILFMARGDKADAKEYFEQYLEFKIPEEEKEEIQKLLTKLNQ